MKLEAVKIENFRSIQSVSLDDCGEFNVVIGKNNAGKSNILLAINAFFKALSKGEPIILKSPIGEVIDHYENLESEPINMSMLFQISQSEKDSLISNIVSEAPQVKNSISRIDAESKLVVAVEVTAGSEPFAYVKQIYLCESPSSISSKEEEVVVKESKRTILEINYEAAQELADKARKTKDLENQIKAIREIISEKLKRMDEEDWNRFREKSGSPATFLERILYFSRRSYSKYSTSLKNSLEELVQNAESKNDFLDAASALADSMQKEADNSITEPIQKRIISFSGEETSVPSYALNLIKAVGEMKVLYLTERREPIGKKEASQLLDLKVTRGGPEKLRAIQDTVSALLGVDIDAFRAEKTTSGRDSSAELDVDQFIVQVNGAGIREALRLILDYELNQPNILLVEEPEIHLHPALETSIMRYLKKIGKDCQIFVTTHSTNFLDTGEMQNVYLASRNNSTTVHHLNLEDAEKTIPKELGIRLSSLFMFDRLVFVEGKTDESMFREWAFTYGINLAQLSVGFIAMGGVRNLSHFAVEATMNFLCKRQVSLFFILDRDERDDPEINKLSSRFGDQASLMVLKKREIENYLLAPKAISKFIALKKELSGETVCESVNLETIDETIQSCAENLKNITIERRVSKLFCVPIRPNKESILEVDAHNSLSERLKNECNALQEEIVRLSESIETQIEEQTDVVNAKWAVDKLNLVPGDILLDNVCQSFGVRFKKEKDAVRLASLMSEDEISSEIKDLLQKFSASSLDG